MIRIFVVALATVLDVTAGAAARPPLAMSQAGTLSCTIETGRDPVSAAGRRVGCTFRHRDARGGRVRERYLGTVSRAGANGVVTSGGLMSWDVMTAGGYTFRDMLSRGFRSVTPGPADASDSAKPLYDQGGGITLRPLGGGAGATELTLRPRA